MNNKGFSIAQVLVSLVVMGIVMTGMMTYTTSLHKSIRQVTVRQSVIELTRQIQYAAGNESLCKCLMSDIKLSSGAKTVLKSLKLGCGTDAPKLEVSKNIESSVPEVTVSKIELSPMQAVTSSSGMTELQIDFASEGGIAPHGIKERILVKLTAGKISSCGEVRTSDLEICAFVGGTYVEATKKCNLPQAVAAAPVEDPNGGSKSRFSSRTCTATENCYVDVAIRKSTPNASVTATAVCYDGEGQINSASTYTNRQIGYTNDIGDYSYTGTWQCAQAPGSRCSQDWLVAGAKVGSHSWSCEK